MSQSDPTDHALAAIASILDQPEGLSFPDSPAPQEIPTAPPSGDAEGYAKLGPGPLQAVRFKWAVRRDDNGGYFVDETIGDNSVPISSGPMSKEAAVKLVDDRESEARRRFEGIKREMATRAVSKEG